MLPLTAPQELMLQAGSFKVRVDFDAPGVGARVVADELHVAAVLAVLLQDALDFAR